MSKWGKQLQAHVHDEQRRILSECGRKHAYVDEFKRLDQRTDKLLKETDIIGLPCGIWLILGTPLVMSIIMLVILR